jgi:hypothetical protein
MTDAPQTIVYRRIGQTAKKESHRVEGRTRSWLKLRKSSRTKPPKLKEILSFDQFRWSQLALHVVDTFPAHFADRYSPLQGGHTQTC